MLSSTQQLNKDAQEAQRDWFDARMEAEKFCFQLTREFLTIDIVAGYYDAAVEDALAMAEAMRTRFVSESELSLIVQQSERSLLRFLDALRLWKTMWTN